MYAREALMVVLLVTLAACSAPSGTPTAPTSTSAVAARTAAGEESSHALSACEEGLFSATDEVGLIEPVARGVIRARNVTIDIATLKRLVEARAPLSINLFADACVVAQPVDVVDVAPDVVAWTGWAADAPDSSHVSMVVTGDAVEASVRTGSQAAFQITYLGGGVHAVLQINPALFPPD